VTDPADLAHEVLIRVAEFIRKLPADQLADLASGEARLDVVPKGGRRPAAARSVGPAAPGPAGSGPAGLPRPARDIAATMSEMGDRLAARRYLDVDLRLTVPKLKLLASELGIAVTGTKPKLIDGIVEWAVGRRLDSEAITRAGGAR
jgi:hypothetical protein